MLRAEVRPGEAGARLNSRSVESGVSDLVRDHTGALTTARVTLSAFVGRVLRTLYEATGLSKGPPDLVIWNAVAYGVRMIEVKNPSWDAPTTEQRRFPAAAAARGIPTAILEWDVVAEKSGDGIRVSLWTALAWRVEEAHGRVPTN